jgi:hypothetical protein
MLWLDWMVVNRQNPLSIRGHVNVNVR